MSEDPERDALLELTAEIVSAYVYKNRIIATEVPALIRDVGDALADAAERAKRPAQPEHKPAVPIREIRDPGLHRLSGGWGKAQDAEAPSAGASRPDAGNSTVKSGVCLSTIRWWPRITLPNELLLQRG